jgi:plasmid maintenance system antidote protein VapI
MPRRARNRGAKLLAKWIEQQDLTHTTAAEELDVAKSYIGLLVNCRATPGLGLACRIEKIAKIPPRAWAERAR